MCVRVPVFRKHRTVICPSCLSVVFKRLRAIPPPPLCLRETEAAASESRIVVEVSGSRLLCRPIVDTREVGCAVMNRAALLERERVGETSRERCDGNYNTQSCRV